MSECSICLLLHNRSTVTLDCKHKFHAECWLSTKFKECGCKVCPLCRAGCPENHTQDFVYAQHEAFNEAETTFNQLAQFPESTRRFFLEMVRPLVKEMEQSTLPDVPVQPVPESALDRFKIYLKLNTSLAAATQAGYYAALRRAIIAHGEANLQEVVKTEAFKAADHHNTGRAAIRHFGIMLDSE